MTTIAESEDLTETFVETLNFVILDTVEQYQRMRETQMLKAEVIIVAGQLVKCRNVKVADKLKAIIKAIEDSEND